MTQNTDEENQKFLIDLLQGAAADIEEILQGVSESYEEKFNESEGVEFLHLKILSQHLAKVISLYPADLREEAIAEARQQEQLVLAYRTSEDPEEQNLLDMPTMGEA